MNNLNSDYLSNIFGYLDDVALTKTSEVCKRWEETSKIDHIWKYLWKEALAQDPTNKLTAPLSGSYRNDFFQIKNLIHWLDQSEYILEGVLTRDGFFPKTSFMKFG